LALYCQKQGFLIYNIKQKCYHYLVEMVSQTGETGGGGSVGLSTLCSCLDVGLIDEVCPARIGGGGGDTVGDLTGLVALNEALRAARFVEERELSAANF
jgi:hypothetical protein